MKAQKVAIIVGIVSGILTIIWLGMEIKKSWQQSAISSI